MVRYLHILYEQDILTSGVGVAICVVRSDPGIKSMVGWLVWQALARRDYGRSYGRSYGCPYLPRYIEIYVLPQWSHRDGPGGSIPHIIR